MYLRYRPTIAIYSVPEHLFSKYLIFSLLSSIQICTSLFSLLNNEKAIHKADWKETVKMWNINLIGKGAYENMRSFKKILCWGVQQGVLLSPLFSASVCIVITTNWRQNCACCTVTMLLWEGQWITFSMIWSSCRTQRVWVSCWTDLHQRLSATMQQHEVHVPP